MHLKKFIMFGLIAAVLPALAEEAADRKTATSLTYVTHELETRQNKFGVDTNKAMEYTNAAGVVQKRAVTSDLDNGGTESIPMVGGVNTKLNQKQDDIDPVNDHTAVTYTGTAGNIGQKGIYQTTESYANQSDNLIDAKTFNAALKKGLDSEFICSESDPNTNLCWVYSIHNPTTDNTLLPDGYTPLEYITGQSGAHINTNIVATNEIKIETVVDRPVPPAQGTVWTPFATPNDPTNGQFAVFESTNSSGTKYVALTYGKVSYSEVSSVSGTESAFNKAKFILDGGVLTYDNGARVINSPQAGQTFNTTHNIWLFGRKNHSNIALPVTMYYTKIWSGGTLVRNFIPAQHGDAVGMYDTVSRRFFTSSAPNTNFTAGPEISNNIYIPQEQ